MSLLPTYRHFINNREGHKNTEEQCNSRFMVRESTISFIMRVGCDLTRTQENSMILGILLSAKFNYVVLTIISKTVLSKNYNVNMNI